jgi:hypothetical protein
MAQRIPRRLRVARLVGELLSPPPILVVLALVVAWELSWYRYEIDLSDTNAERLRKAGIHTVAELESVSLEELVTHVIVHEVGHHFGLSDPDMEAIEAAAW